MQKVVVPEPQYAEASRLQPGRTPLIVFDCIGMLASVHFDYEPSFEADEIDDVWTHRNLAPEAIAGDLFSAEPDQR